MPVTLTTKVLHYNNNNTEYKTIDAISPPISEGNYLPADAGITGAHAGDVLYISAVDADGRPTAYSSSPVFHTMTIHVTDSNGDYISGVPIKIRHGTEEGEIYASEITTNQPLSFSLPTGFPYYIDYPYPTDIGDYINVTNSDSGEQIITDTNKVINLIYMGVDSIKTAQDIKDALENYVDLSALVGNSITCTRNGQTLVWDVIEYTSGAVTIMLHSPILVNMPFDLSQTIRYVENGLAAGSYKVQRDTPATDAYFTLTSAIPEGGQIVVDFTNNTFATYEASNASTPIETGATTSTEISGATNLGTTGLHLNHINRVNYGSNNYAESGIRAWLNSDAEAGEVIYSATDYGRPYTTTEAGFLNGLDEDFLNAIAESGWGCQTNLQYECSAERGGEYYIDDTYTVYDMFAIPSDEEIFDSSLQFELFIDAAPEDLIKYDADNTTAYAYWLRTPVANNCGKSYYVTTSGTLSESGEYCNSATCAIVPIAKIEGSIK